MRRVPRFIPIGASGKVAMSQIADSNPPTLAAGGELPYVPDGPVTKESLAAEAAALGDGFSDVSTPTGDLVADAEELLESRDDLPDLVAREYPVTSHHFDRVALLVTLVSGASVPGEVAAGLSVANTKTADAALARLLKIRGEIAGIGKAAGLPEGPFSLQTHRTTRLNVVMERLEDVLAAVGRFRARMPDKRRLDALAVEARRLIDEQKQARRHAKFLRAERTVDTRQGERYERLLLNVLQYLSAQGLAAYPDDPVREIRYRLEHINGDRTRAASGGEGDGGKPA